MQETGKLDKYNVAEIGLALVFYSKLVSFGFSFPEKVNYNNTLLVLGKPWIYSNFVSDGCQCWRKYSITLYHQHCSVVWFNIR